MTRPPVCPECAHGYAWHDAQGCAHGFCACTLTHADFTETRSERGR